MGTLYVCATPIGNMSDVSQRLINTLSNVDYILVEDTRRTIKLLNHFDIKKKMVSYHKFNEKERSNKVIQDLMDGKNIALVSDAGTPCISDPGYEVVKQARINNIDVMAIPGPSALVSALSISGFELTSFSFYGFLPRENKKQEEILKVIKGSNVPAFVIYESPNRIIKTLGNIAKHMTKALVMVASDLTKLHEKSYFGPVHEVIETLKKNEKSNLGEYTVVIDINEEILKEEKAQSLESQLIEMAVQHDCSIKKAVALLNEESKYSKSDLYQASLNIKNILSKRD